MWTFDVTDLSENRIGEVTNAQGRSLSLHLNGLASVNFSIRTDNPLYVPMHEKDTFLRAWKDGTLMFNGPILSLNTQGSSSQNPVCQINAVDVGWRLGKRLSGKASEGEEYKEKDKIEIAKKLIEKDNEANDTGIRMGSLGTTAKATYTAGPYKPTLACITDLSATLDGFDWYFEPARATEAIPNQRAKFVAKEVVGTEKTAVRLEYGEGLHNVQTFGFVRDLDTVVNRAFNISEGTSSQVVEDAASIATRGYFEEITNSPNLTDSSLIKQWLESVVSVRRNPRNIVSLTLEPEDGTSGRVPKFENSSEGYWLGDVVQTQAVMPDGVKLFSGKVRVYKVNIAINEAGTASYTPVLVDEGGLSF